MIPYYEANGITIYHGDCRALTLPEKPALVLADPPYGVNENTKRASGGRGMRPDIPRIAYDYPPVAGDDEPYDPAHLLALAAPSIFWGANHYADKLPVSPSWFVWDKKEAGTPDDNADCEMAWTNLGGPARLYHHLWRGFLKASERDQIRKHPTQKPVALMRWCLTRAKLQLGALVYDPYMGSGPVAKACKQLGYRYIGCELVEQYCETTALGLQQEVMELV